MNVQIGAKPDSGFDNPLGMLKDCHRRIEHFLNILVTVARRAQARSLHPDETAAVEAALNYFRIGGQRHTADEEESLFPRLHALDGFAQLEQLEQDHAEAGKLHDQLDSLYRNWIAAGSLHQDEALRLSSASARLHAIYQEHIQIEDNIIFPKAAQSLDSGTIELIGQEFRTRRSL